ncbi:PepSY domain-containing protein [Saccharospirillum sp.]|uniref:PepSY domain-containing protein n=2 Tax=Saccharospirillum sp. TaxID=2033801 RepID=UPI0034A08AC1
MSSFAAAHLRRLGISAVMLWMLAVSGVVQAENNRHPCTSATLPLTTERQVVQSAECLFDGRVVKVDRVSAGSDWAYRLRLLLDGGRVRTVDLNRETGMPIDPAVLEEVNETLDR